MLSILAWVMLTFDSISFRQDFNTALQQAWQPPDCSLAGTGPTAGGKRGPGLWEQAGCDRQDNSLTR